MYLRYYLILYLNRVQNYFCKKIYVYLFVLLLSLNYLKIVLVYFEVFRCCVAVVAAVAGVVVGCCS